MTITIRTATDEDEPFLWEMQYFAAMMDVSGERFSDIRSHPAARYVEGWGRTGDLGVIAVDSHSDRGVGAAWCRMFTGEVKGFGYVDDQTPEMAIAIKPEYRSKGVGSRLMRALLERATQEHPCISLAVRSTNPAVLWYESFGFQRLPEKDFMNRLNIRSYVMMYSADYRGKGSKD